MFIDSETLRRAPRRSAMLDTRRYRIASMSCNLWLPTISRTYHPEHITPGGVSIR